MGKITGFLEYQRLNEAAEAPEVRKKHYHEFVLHLSEEEAKVQGARCMDCGIPFCMTGCPVNNIIPDFNDLVFKADWLQALDTLHSTNNFPEFTGRVCPAPCEEACTLRINNDPVGIKSIEHAIIDKGWEEGWVKPLVASAKSGKRIAVVGSGPAGLAAAQQLARAGHSVVLFEKNDRIGGLLRYGIPDFKMEKGLIDRRVAQMQAEGVEFRTNQLVGAAPVGAGNAAAKVLDPATIADEFDAVVLTGGAEQPRDLPVPGRKLAGVHFAMEITMSAPKANGCCSTGVQKQLSTASSAPHCFATVAIAAMSEISVSGLDGVSRKNSFVFGRTAAFHSATSVADTYVVSTPNFLMMLLNRLIVAPNTLRDATMWSPALSSPITQANIADMPDAVAIHCSAPSIAARRSSNIVTVGLVKRA